MYLLNVYLIVKVQLRGFIPSRGRTRESQKYKVHCERPSYHDWQLGLKLYDMEYMGINFGKEIQTETKALKVKN
jgi:hypothetical protein